MNTDGETEEGFAAETAAEKSLASLPSRSLRTGGMTDKIAGKMPAVRGKEPARRRRYSGGVDETRGAHYYHSLVGDADISREPLRETPRDTLRETPIPRATLAGILVCFFLSGAAG